MLPFVRFLTLALAAVLVVANTAEPPVTYLPNRVHLAGLLKRKAGLTHDQFLTYMTAHAELLRSTNVTKYFTKYDVMPINATVNAMLNASGSLTTDYDGMVLFEGTSFDELLAGFSSPEALSIINPNEELFLERNLTITLPMNFASVVDKEPCEP